MATTKEKPRLSAGPSFVSNQTGLAVLIGDLTTRILSLTAGILLLLARLLAAALLLLTGLLARVLVLLARIVLIGHREFSVV